MNPIRAHRIGLLLLLPLMSCTAIPRTLGAETNHLVFLATVVNGQFREVKPNPLLTNHFFLSVDADVLGDSLTVCSSDGFAIKPEKIQEAKQAKDSQPAEEDPEGNWGDAVRGLQLSLRFHQPSFKLGEPILATVIFRNVTNTALDVPPKIPGFKTEFVVIDESGKQLEPNTSVKERRLAVDEARLVEQKKLTEFQRKLRHLVSSPQSCAVMPHTQMKFRVQLDQVFEFPAPGRYSLRIQYAKNSTFEASSGTAKLTILPAALNPTNTTIPSSRPLLPTK